MDQLQYLRVQHVILGTQNALRANVEDIMTVGSAQSIWRWGLQPGYCQHQTWTQLMGLSQLATLTTGLLDQFVSPQLWPALLHYAATLNTYLTYEVVSDNLALGCAHIHLAPSAGHLALLRGFN